ncbi:MAG: putative oxidoreductase [Crocinitomicaceae bacterium]|jgi:putative oxidoreductase
MQTLETHMKTSLNTLASTLTNTAAGFDTLPVRIAVGILFMAHGAQKLFGWFGGYGLEGTAGWMSSIGLEPGLLMATLAGSAEFFGGLFLVLGLLVRPAGLLLAITMVVAIFTVHFANGVFMSNNGYEYALVLLVVSLGLVVRGAGSLSLDAIVQKKLQTPTSL